MRTVLNGGAFASPNRSSVNGQHFQPWWFYAGQPLPQYRDPINTVGIFTPFMDRYFSVSTVYTVSDFFWPYSYELDRDVEPITRLSSNEAVIVPGATDDLWTFASAGPATITLSSPGRTVSREITTTTQFSVSTIFQYLDAFSAAANARQNVYDRAEAVLDGFDAAQRLSLFSSDICHPDFQYTRNPDFFAADVDFSCFSPWNSGLVQKRAGTLISPRHIVFAAHWPLSSGETIVFVTPDNVTVSRAIVATQAVIGDIAMGILDSDVPAGISFAPLASPDLTRLCVPESSEARLYPWPVPLLVGHQNKRLSIVTNPYLGASSIVLNQPTDELSVFYEPAIDGDSGSPVFFIINGQAVLATCLFYGGPGSGPYYARYLSEINAAMTALSTLAGASTNYQATVVDLSGFNAYA